ncbi:histidine kinase [Novosphingobium sp. BL-8H]|uniref:histidine kinase n=1 Tax=Novosphingobium sp. BL-8H TaxID=3127640 RepID=UPI0037566960
MRCRAIDRGQIRSGILIYGAPRRSVAMMDSSRFKPTPIPRERRRGQLTPYVLTDSRGQAVEVMIRDVSSRGFSAAAVGAAPAINEVIRAVLDDGREVWGLVRWADGNLFGVEFEAGDKPKS